MEESQLKMNDAKTEFIVIGILHNLKKNMLDNIEIVETKVTGYQKLNSLEYIWIKY